MNKFNMAIIGAGNIATQMAKAINGLDDVNAYAIASRDLTKAQKFAEEYKFDKAYGTYEELVKDEKIDLVYIATPHSEHYAHAKLCIEHGKPVLVEKAFTANARQAKEIIELAKEKGVFLTEAIWTRYMPGRRMIQDIIASGKIGKVDSLEADFSIPICNVPRMNDPALAGGALLDLGMYTLTFASMFLGDDIISTESRCIKYRTGVDATDFIELTYRDGKQAFLRTSMVSGSKNEGKINGTDGYIEVFNLNSLEKINIYDSDGQLKETLIPPKIVNGYEYEVMACKQAIGEGKLECDMMPHSETLLIMEQMDKLRRKWDVKYPFE